MTARSTSSSPNPLPYGEFMAARREAAGVKLGLPATRWMLETGVAAGRAGAGQPIRLSAATVVSRVTARTSSGTPARSTRRTSVIRLTSGAKKLS